MDDVLRTVRYGLEKKTMVEFETNNAWKTTMGVFPDALFLPVV